MEEIKEPVYSASQWVWGLILAIVVAILVFIIYLPVIQNFLIANIPNAMARTITIAIFIGAIVYLITGITFYFVDFNHDCRKSQIYAEKRNFEHIRQKHNRAKVFAIENRMI